jgi:hypothetical protein
MQFIIVKQRSNNSFKMWWLERHLIVWLPNSKESDWSEVRKWGGRGIFLAQFQAPKNLIRGNSAIEKPWRYVLPLTLGSLTWQKRRDKLFLVFFVSLSLQSREYMGKIIMLSAWLRKIKIPISIDDQLIWRWFLWAICMLRCSRYPEKISPKNRSVEELSLKS